MVAAVGQAFEHGLGGFLWSQLSVKPSSVALHFVAVDLPLLLTHTRVDPEDGVAAATGQDDGAVARGALQDGEWLLAIIISTSEGGGGGRIKEKGK